MTAPVTAPTLPAALLPERDDPRNRGRLVMTKRVIEKVAGQAAAEVATTSGRTGGLLGIGATVDAGARPSVDVDLSAASADLSIKVGIRYPGSLRRAAQQVREHVTRRVEELTGVDVRRVDIDVTFLTLESGPRRPGVLR